MAGLLGQAGFADESTFNTPVAVTRFFEIVNESVIGNYDRIESAGIRAGQLVQRSTRFAVAAKGAAGDVNTEVTAKGFGYWLKHMCGSVASGTLTDSTYTHTGTIGSLTGKSFTAQFGRPDTTDTVQAFTYSGGKVASWELSTNVDQLLALKLGLDFAQETLPPGSGVTALQSASYPTETPKPNELMSWVGGSVKVAGVEVAVSDFSLKVDNKLKTDRFMIKAAAGKKEQLQDGMRALQWSATVEFESAAHITRVAALTAAGTLTSLSGQWQCPTLAGATTYPGLLVTMPAARWDNAPVNIADGGMLTQKVGGVILWDTTNSPVSLAYTTVDATP